MSRRKHHSGPQTLEQITTTDVKTGFKHHRIEITANEFLQSHYPHSPAFPTVEQQKNSSTENWTPIIEKKIKNTIHKSLQIRQNSSAVILQNAVSVMVQ